MFNIGLKEDYKIFQVSIEGKVTPNEGEKFIKNLKDELKSIETEEYNLVVKLGNIQATSVKMMFILGSIMDIYKRTNFKRVFSIVEDKNKGQKFVRKFQRQIGREVILCEDISCVLDKL